MRPPARMRALSIFLTLSFLLTLPVWTVSANAASSCGWDSSQGWVKRENSKIGYRAWSLGIPVEFSGDFAAAESFSRTISPQSGRFGSLSPKIGPEGWFASPSATCGQSVGLHISGNGAPVTIRVFRMGYYKGAGARLIQTVTTRNVRHYLPEKISKPPLNTVVAKWPEVWKFSISKSTPPGQYLIRLDDGTGDSNLVPIMVTNPDARNDVTFVSSILTWQAYNAWGGYSLYKGPNLSRQTRAMVVSFNRPYDGDGAGQFRYMELPIIRLAEKLGIDTNYLTDLELIADAPALHYTKSIVLGGHSEYWTAKMREVITKVVSQGVNLVSFGGNAAYNRPILQANNRELVMWRGAKSDTHRNNPDLATTRWRSSPIGRPESVLLGAQYVGLGVNGNYTVTHPLRWPFTVMKGGVILRGVVGREVDSPLYAPGPGVENLAWAQIKLHGRPVTAMATYYTNAKKAGIIDISTNGWTCAMDNVCPWHPPHFAQTRVNVQAITAAILKGLVKGPLGLWRPAVVDVPKRTKTSKL